MFKLLLVFSIMTVNIIIMDGKWVRIPGIADFAEKVHIGDDTQMSLVGDKFFSLNPSVDVDGIVLIPDEIDDALKEMYSASPKWFLKAMIEGRDDFECSVFVNGFDYTYYFDSWLYINWKLFDGNSNLRNEILNIIKDPGSEDVILRSYLIESFCFYAKHNDLEKAKTYYLKYL